MTRNHKAHFKWRKNDSGEDCIYDGSEMIAAFYSGTEGLPEHDYSNMRPVSLHNLLLQPGGEVMIEEGEICGPLCLSWRKDLTFNMVVDELKVDDSDPEVFRLYVRTRDTAFRKDQPGHEQYKPAGFREESWLELTHDHELASYVYDVRTRFTLVGGGVDVDFIKDHDNRGWEFGDILPADADSLFPPRGHKKYTHLVYKGSDGQFYNRPQNKHLGPDKFNLFYAPDGMISFVSEPCGNPTIEFLDETGSMVMSEICWAMYDLHFRTKREVQCELLEAGKPIEVHYRFYSLPHEKAEKLLQESTPDPILEHPMVRCPVFNEDGVNAFIPSDEYRSPSDKWFWLCTDPRCQWDWDTGFESNGSLMIHRESEKYDSSFGNSAWCGWYNISDGSDCSQWVFPRLKGDADYTIKAKIRTSNVEGKVYLGLKYWTLPGAGIQEYSELFVSDEVLASTGDWAEVTLRATRPSGPRPPYLAAVFFVLEGKGQCWLDEMEIIER